MLGYRDRVPFVNTDETLHAFQKALAFMQQVHQANGHVLLVNTNPHYSAIVKKTALRIGHPYVNEYWVGGLLTNWKQLKYAVHAYKHFEATLAPMMREDGVVFPKYAKAQKRFMGVQHMTRMPDAVFVFQATTTHKHIVHEAQRLGIPVIACMDTYAPQLNVEYPIPMNVLSKAFVHFLCACIVSRMHVPKNTHT